MVRAKGAYIYIYILSESILDRQAPANLAEEGRVLAFACSDCQCMFASTRTLASHRRMRHGDRSAYRKFLPGPVCPACGTICSSRVLCLMHIGDRRRPMCADWLLKHGRPLPPATVARLDKADTLLRREAQQQGFTGPRATKPARRADGRVLGKISS